MTGRNVGLQATGTPLGVERTGRRSSPPTPPTGSHHDRAPTTGSAALIQARNILSFLSGTSRASGENCIASPLPQGGLCSVEPQLERLDDFSADMLHWLETT